MTVNPEFRKSVDNVVLHLCQVQQALAQLYEESRKCTAAATVLSRPEGVIAIAIGYQEDAALCSAFARELLAQFTPMLKAVSELDRRHGPDWSDEA